jgi:tetratricopeptide (TPR) repeat protein
MKLKSIFFSLVIFMSALSIFADNNKFTKANELYSKGKYEEAKTYYEELINNGHTTADIYYNLGNTYFKLDKIADAILYYERAKKIAPGDEDIEFNLRIANLKIVDKINNVPQLFFIEWYESIHGWFSSGTWSVFIIIFSWLSFISLAGYFIIWNINLRKVSFFATIISFIIMIACIIFSLEQYNVEQSKEEAIIFSPSVYIKSSPDKGSTDLFILHEGTKVKILDEVGDWKKIKIADGNIGWLPTKTIEII